MQFVRGKSLCPVQRRKLASPLLSELAGPQTQDEHFWLRSSQLHKETQSTSTAGKFLFGAQISFPIVSIHLSI